MSFKVSYTEIDGPLILEPEVFCDHRGFFYESFNLRDFKNLTNFHGNFVQDNHSRSSLGVLRGLHFQSKNSQGKLVRVVDGCIFDVFVDLRKSSANFGQWASVELSDKNMKQLWIPPGFAHGFQVLSHNADIIYKTTDFWNPNNEHAIRWNDEFLAINWPLYNQAKVSKKDEGGKSFKDIDESLFF